MQAAGMRGPGKSTLADRAKYQFEADSEDDEMENEIDSNLDQVGSLVYLSLSLVPLLPRQSLDLSDRVLILC